MGIVSSAISVSGPRSSAGMPSPNAAVAISNKPTPRSVPFTTKRPCANSMSALRRFQHDAGDAAPFLGDGVGGLGDDPRSEPHRSRRGRAAAALHAVDVAGYQPDSFEFDPETSLMTWARLVSWPCPADIVPRTNS